MSCKCLNTIRDNLEKHHGAGSDVELDLKTAIDVERLELSSAMPPLYYSYKAGKKRKTSYVKFNFCPFCGKSSKGTK